VRGTHRFGWLAAATAAVALVTGTGAAGAAVNPFVTASGALSDLAPGTDNATDGASARVYAVPFANSTYVVLLVSGLDPEAARTTYGAHVHVGPCVEGDGAAAGPHYNAGGTPSPDTEVWLDFEVLPGGYGFAIAIVPFQIQEGAAQSVVIHAQPTQEGGATPGAAGARIACLPVAF
jgi:Cu/Zn superoxide dismutase